MLSSWERTLKLACFNHHVIAEINKKHQVNWLLLDLGLENISEEQLNNALDRMLKGFNRLFKYKAIKQVNLGYFRMLDIIKKGDTFHLRIHILLPVIKSYFQGRYYIKFNSWISLWSRAVGLENGLYVSVKVMNGKEDVSEIFQEKILKFREQNSEIPLRKSNIITSRRLVGYSRLLKNIANQSLNENKFHLGENKLCIDDPVANQAFVNMLKWHPGLREVSGNYFFK
ncbi:protein rep [Bacillus thuringiensis]|uniref:protein rep n=1 Tax=Bacillus thuringiensis TaxID=1428 RepID=UPI000CF926AA|nr:protein rep [Bacillus thuringiensis]PQQ47854.1 replication protein [Bacillus thuringiensis]